MSLHIPIYKRILYDSLEQNKEQNKTAVTSLSIVTSNDVEERMMVPVERQTMSAPTSLPLYSGDSLQQRRLSFPRNLVSAPSNISIIKLNGDGQTNRWKERERHLNQSRTLKRTSNIIAHRQDLGYFISGSRLPLINKYDIEEEELIRLRMLAHSRADKSTRTNSRNTSAATRKFSMSPSGQTVSPVPPISDPFSGHGNKTNAKDEREKRKELQRKKEMEKQKRLEEKERFEKEMEEKYKPKKPVQKSMIFITESDDNDRQRTFLTDGDFMENSNKNDSMYSFINDNQRNAFTSIFNEIDKNKDGKIDIDELKQYLSSLVSKEKIKYLLQVFDLNKDHIVDVREFVTICALNDKLCGITTENETVSLALDLERLAQHITIYKELFNVVDEDGDGRVQSDEVLLLVMTALEGENIEENMEENNTDKNMEENNKIDNTNALNTEDLNENNTKRFTTKVKKKFNKDESKQVLDSIEKDENGFIDFVSFLSYIPFFTQLLKVIMDSPLSISSLEKTRDKVTRKLTKNIN